MKGRIGTTVEVMTANNSAACGIEMSVGQRTGLFLFREGGRWIGHMCWQVEPGHLLAVAALPTPNGRGPVKLFVGGRFGPARMLALDSMGRTLAYGTGAGRTGLLSRCPGGDRLAEISFLSAGPYRAELAIRDARTLAVMMRHPLRLGPLRAEELLCEDKFGSSVLLFAGPAGDAPINKALYRLLDQRLMPIWHGDAHHAELRSTVVYLSAGAKGESLLAVDPRTGRRTRLARLPEGVDPLRLKPSGTHLAGVDFRPDRPSRIVLVDLKRQPASVRMTVLGNSAYGDVTWLPSGRFLFLPSEGRDAARIFDLGLRAHSEFRWLAERGTVVGSTVFGIDYSRGSLVSAKLPNGPQRVVRTLPGKPETIVAVTSLS